MSRPKWIIILGLIAAFVSGTVMPLFGIILAKLLFKLDPKLYTLLQIQTYAS